MTISRIKHRSDFLAANTSGKKFIVGCLILQMNERKEGHPAGHSEPRIGFTVTKKMGGAVVRNRIKRRLRAATDQLPAEILKPGHDYVIISRSKALDCEFSEVVRDMQFAFSKIIHHKSRPTL